MYGACDTCVPAVRDQQPASAEDFQEDENDERQSQSETSTSVYHKPYPASTAPQVPGETAVQSTLGSCSSAGLVHSRCSMSTLSVSDMGEKLVSDITQLMADGDHYSQTTHLT